MSEAQVKGTGSIPVTSSADLQLGGGYWSNHMTEQLLAGGSLGRPGLFPMKYSTGRLFLILDEDILKFSYG